MRVHSSDVSGRDWLINIHKVGLQISRLKKDLSFIPALNVFFRVEKYIDYQQKRCFLGTLMYSLDWEYHLYVYTECVTERMLSRVSYFVLCVKMKLRTNHM